MKERTVKLLCSVLVLGLVCPTLAADGTSWGSLLEVQKRLDSAEGRLAALEARVAEIERLSREIQAAVQPKPVVAGTVVSAPEVAVAPLPLAAPYLVADDCPTGQCGIAVTGARRAVIRNTWSSPGTATVPTITAAPTAAYYGGTSGGCSMGFRARTTIRATGGGGWYLGKYLSGGCGG